MAHEVARVAKHLEEAKETKCLDVSHCKLTKVPDAVYLMLKDTLIEICILNGNLLKQIPSRFFTKFPFITDLHLEDNKLSMLPEEIRTLDNLSLLNIAKNNFDSIPNHLFDCLNLKTVIARSNQIKDVEVDRLYKMESLQQIDLMDNPLSSDTEVSLSEIDRFTILMGISEPMDKELEQLD